MSSSSQFSGAESLRDASSPGVCYRVVLGITGPRPGADIHTIGEKLSTLERYPEARHMKTDVGTDYNRCRGSTV